jgi:hypothetical protein
MENCFARRSLGEGGENGKWKIENGKLKIVKMSVSALGGFG